MRFSRRLWSCGGRICEVIRRSFHMLKSNVQLTGYRRAFSQILWVLAAAVWISSATTCWSQATTGSIVGTVTDPTQAVVPNAQITATNVSTGVVSNTSNRPATTGFCLYPSEPTR